MERNKPHSLTKEFILFTSNNFPSGGPSASYLNLFCKGVTENRRKISVYLFKGHVYKDYKKNECRVNKTDYGVDYTYLGFVNRKKNKLLKIVEGLVSVFMTFILMFRLSFKRKSLTIFLYSNEVIFNIPVYFICKLFSITTVSFVPETYDTEAVMKGSIFKKLKWYSLLLNYNILNKLSDKLIVFSSFLKNEYICMGYDEKNIVIQPNLTDFNGWYIPGKEIQYTLGYAGTPSGKDGIFDLISAIKILKDKGTIINAIIIGDSIGNESYLPHLKEHCKNSAVLDQIIFKGLLPQDQVKEYLNCCRILAITRPNTRQTQAGFPTKLGEYMGCKKVVLATRFGDIEKYFTDKKDIVLADTDSPFSIAENISWILNNSERSEMISINGFNIAKEILNYQAGVLKILNSLN